MSTPDESEMHYRQTHARGLAEMISTRATELDHLVSAAELLCEGTEDAEIQRALSELRTAVGHAIGPALILGMRLDKLIDAQIQRWEARGNGGEQGDDS